MTYSTDQIADLFALFEGAGLRPPPQLATDAGYELAVRVWAAALDGIPVQSVQTAFVLHLRHPERGRFWPVPADLISHMPQVRSLALVPVLDPDELAWEQIWAVMLKGVHAPEVASTVTFEEVTSTEEIRRWDAKAQAEVVAGTQPVTRVVVRQSPSAFERSLTAERLAALRQIGGLAALRQADDIGRATLRKRFLGLCRTPPTPVEASPGRPAIPAGATAFLRMALSAPDPVVERQRREHIDRAQREG